eukprot:TRINITY_DN8795_c0_g1_i3.p1 TRINITY_DN8795_c0_g1~~TRINITY_DN8795_c0_g1_i3.p1  ORF type:complete len:125 (+),score=38.35 TRINITY_DN8795_c0_g1_i3:476-850(+)
MLLASNLTEVAASGGSTHSLKGADGGVVHGTLRGVLLDERAASSKTVGAQDGSASELVRHMVKYLSGVEGTEGCMRGVSIEVAGTPRSDELPVFLLCLLYTSDAADEEDSVDLGGRRLVKKKKR